mgnify:CR=1 FL=1
MKKQKKLLLQILIFFIIVLSGCRVFAVDFGQIEISEEYKKYMELSDEEQEKVIMPRMYDVLEKTTVVTNPLRLAQILGATVDSKYSLRDVIPANMVVRNQQTTNTCWTFSSIGMLESTLALQDYKNGKSPVAYDFSERHMDYAMSYTFKDGINKKGFYREAGSGGSFNIFNAYFTNGTGAVLESEMPFENNSDKIELSKIQNLKAETQVNDTIEFPKADTNTLKQLIKDHIKNYGGVDAGIYGASLNNEAYNNETGALYCNDKTKYNINHDIVIVGWDDDYSKENFKEGSRPQNDGAWIIKNSWGTERQRYNLTEMKNKIINELSDMCNQKGWKSAEDIPDEDAKKIFKNNGFTIENNEAYIKVGDNGFMYVSYEDVNIYSQLSAIKNAQYGVSYENIYQYDDLGGVISIPMKNISKAYLATEFDKKTTGTEYLTQVAVTAKEAYTCKVYVNPNGTSKDKKDLQQIQLKVGESETFDAGYHTIEFLNPIKITGENFVVVLEIQGIQTDKITLLLETKVSDYTTNNNAARLWDNVTIESGKCFVATEDDVKNNQWTDTSNTNFTINGVKVKGDTTIKAFTTSKLDSAVIEGIEISTPPTKTEYLVGENFDKSGMIVKAKYSDGTSKIITDYTINDGTSLKEGQKSVTLEYEGKTTTQTITVKSNISEEKTVKSISVKTMPTKTEYIQNQDNLDLTGGIIEVTYSDDSKAEISMTSEDVTASGFDNTTLGNNTITITYKEKTLTFDIEIKENDKEDIKKPLNSNFDNMQGKVTRMRAYYFTDVTKNEYTILSVDINNITLASGNDKTEYYYYLSSNPKETNIENWIKIDKLDKTDNDISFEINTSDVSNYEEIAKENDLYLYIKEVATLNDQQQEKVTSPVKLEVNNITIEKYVDGSKKEDVDSGTIVNPTPASKPDNKSNSETVDNTIASGVIPKAGKSIVIIGAILILIVVGRILYVKYKNIQIK